MCSMLEDTLKTYLKRLQPLNKIQTFARNRLPYLFFWRFLIFFNCCNLMQFLGKIMQEYRRIAVKNYSWIGLCYNIGAYDDSCMSVVLVIANISATPISNIMPARTKLWPISNDTPHQYQNCVWAPLQWIFTV